MRDLDPVDLARRLTLADLVLRPIGDAWLRPGMLALAVLGLVLPSVARSAWFWLLLSALTALRLVDSWPLADNHAYLLVYWCLAVAIASRDDDPQRTLAFEGRVLLALVFTLAVLWKALSPDYLDGRFFRVALVTDERLAPYAQIVGGLDDDALLERREELTRHVDAPEADAAAPSPESMRFYFAALAATWGAFAWEVLLALAFLWPAGPGVARFRDPLLIGFCALTFLVAPVSGFGWLLIALGVAQTEAGAVRMRAAYVGVFALVYLYRELPRAWLAFS